MNNKHKTIRESLRSMSYTRALDRIKSFHLPADEELFVIEIDVNRLSYQQVADKYHVTHEVIKSKRRQAYQKIADAIEYEREKKGGTD